MAVLYVTEQGSVLRKESKRLVIEKEGKVLLEVPEFKVDRVLIFGNIQVTTQAISFLLERGIETSFFTISGRLKGKLSPLESKNVFLRVFQYKRYLDEEFKLNLSKIVIEGKIKNEVVFLQRYQRNHQEIDFSLPLKKLGECLNALSKKTKVSTVIGVEGFASSIYFEALGKMFRKELSFETRSRRPPGDPVNALLSLGYTLITNEILSLISGIGFDPYIGYLHGINYGRPSLALDLVEEFRHPIIDRLTLSLINKEVLNSEDFEEKDGGFYLEDKPRKDYFLYYEKYLQRKFSYEGEELNFRRLFQIQTQKMAKTIQEKVPYHYFLMK